MSKLRTFIEQIRCDHSRACAASYICLIACLLSFSSGFAGYYLSDLKNDSDIARLSGAYADAMSERDARLEILIGLTNRIEDAAEHTDRAADKSIRAAESIRHSVSKTVPAPAAKTLAKPSTATPKGTPRVVDQSPWSGP